MALQQVKQSAFELGQVPFSREAMRERIPEFRAIFDERPIRDNHGGMRAPHLFATWFMVQVLKPAVIVESGVFKGLGTWILERAAPHATLYCIEPNPAQIVYRARNASYLTEDFSEREWDLDPATTLLFFDDHQDALSRVSAARARGFRHLIFEDNYPAGRGDCYSLKQAFMGVAPPPSRNLAHRAWRAIRGADSEAETTRYLTSVLDAYYEFPPVCRPAVTRWGDRWDEERYPTPQPLFDDLTAAADPFVSEAAAYTWICYARLNGGPSSASA